MAVKIFFLKKKYSNVFAREPPIIKCTNDPYQTKILDFNKNNMDINPKQNDHKQSDPIQNDPIQNDPNQIDPNQIDTIQIDTNRIDIRQINIYTKEFIDNRKEISHLGEGTYGKVSRCMIGNDEIALKKFGTINNTGIEQNMLREVNILKMLNHPNIVGIHGIYYSYDPIVMYAGLELMDMRLISMIETTKLSDESKMNYILQLLEGVKYMHSKNIMHRDITINNVLVKGNVLKISDFGTSIKFYDSNYKQQFTNEVCTLHFRAIELLLGKKPYTYKIDVWSTACIIGYILQENYLFCPDSQIDLLYRIFRCLGTPCEELNKEVCTWPEFRSTFPKWKRIGFVDLEKKYPKQTEILYKMFEYEPDNRITISEAL